MPSQLVIRLLLWAVALNAGLLLLLLWRRGLQGRWGYALLLGLDAALAGALIYTGRVQHPLAMIAIGAFVFLVIVPMLIRMVTAWAVQRGRWGLAHRLTAVRELLQPGAGVGRERELLEVIQQVQDGDVGDILTRLKERAAQEEDEELRGLLHEQVLTLMVIERRWDESLEYTAEHVTPHLVAARPRLGAALIRVYGEVGDIDGLVRTMYLVEGGPGGQDPEHADVLEHCRFMVLAFTGHAEALGELLAPGTNSAVEPRVRHFWLGVAHQQAGDAEAARFQYGQALDKLGAQDERARRTIQARMADVAGGCEPVHVSDPDQTGRLVAAIRERAKLTMARPRLQTGTWRHTPATLLLVCVNVIVFAAMELLGQGSKDHLTLIQAGASLTHAVGAGEYWRLASAMFLHASWLHLAVNLFMLWFLGRFAEQLMGSLRFGIVYVVAGITGNLASHLWRVGPISVGASSSIFGILGAALVVLMLSRGRVPEGWRRSMVFVLALVIGLNFLPGLDVPVIDNYAHLGGLLGGALVGGLLYRTVFQGRLGSVLATVFGGACVLVLIYCVWGLLTSDLDRLAWAKSRGAGATVSHPATWFVLPTRRANELEIVCLVHRDQIVIERMGPVQVGSLSELHRVRTQELQASAAKPSGQGRMTVRPLPPGALPRGWAGVRLDIHRTDGSRIAEAFALGLRGPPSAPVEWQVLLKTRPERFQRAMKLFHRMLSELRTD
ncbi:MAG: rhomboid family intramembrane serine protease [bacterium]